MLELEHWRIGVWVHSCEPRTGHHRDYIAGRDKPHYPVPAIPVKVTWHMTGLLSIKQDGKSRIWFLADT